MKFTCEREKFLHSFQIAASVAPTRSPKPILQNVKLEVSGDMAQLTATDLDVALRTEVGGLAVESPGTMVLPVGRFGSILRESSDEKLSIETDGTNTVVRGRSSEFQLPAENPDDYPTVTSFNEERYHEVPAVFFRQLVRRTIFATDNESSRYALGGVMVSFVGDEIDGVGTDGRRLAWQHGPAKSVGGHDNEGMTTIIPTRAMTILDRALAESDDEVQLSVRENDVLVRSRRMMLYARLVEGRFPKWRDVLPNTEGATSFELAVGPFHSAVRQAAIVTSDERRGVDFTFGEGKLALAAFGAEDGQSHVEMPLAYEGPGIVVTLDPRYLSDFLRVLDPAQTITMTVRNAETAAVLRTGDGYTYIVMPLARK